MLLSGGHGPENRTMSAIVVPMNYYNEIEPFAAEWLVNLSGEGHIPDGTVDTRSIVEVDAEDVRGYTQCHFFAGIGGWPEALRLAGWPADREVWTGSCPCQPFSAAGKQKGTADERHLWPELFRLISECRPATVFGEQVASKAGREWLSGIFADLESVGYAVAGADLCSAGVGAPHIRQRLFWVAYTTSSSRAQQFHESCEGSRRPSGPQYSAEHIGTGGMADHKCERFQGTSRQTTVVPGEDGWLGNSNNTRPQGRGLLEGQCGDELSSWTSVSHVHCTDGKTRRVPHPESGVQPLAYGIPRKLGFMLPWLDRVEERSARHNRVGRLKGYGNAIVPQVAAEFVKAFMESDNVCFWAGTS